MYWTNFDSGDDKVSYISQADFYKQVFTSLGVSIDEERDKMDTFLAEIGALAVIKADESEVIRFDILCSAWLVHGYLYSSFRKLKRVNGLNFNMLSAKSIRIMNRLVAVVSAYTRLYQAKKNMLAPLPQDLKTVSAAIMALVGDEVDNQAGEVLLNVEKFNRWLYRLKVRKGTYDVPNLSKFLSWARAENNSGQSKSPILQINVRSLIVAVDEFMRSQYL